MSSSASFLRQLSTEREAYRSNSWRWGTPTAANYPHCYTGGGSKTEEDMNNMYGGYGRDNGGGRGVVMKKRVMILVDQTSHSKHAMMWALTHVTTKGDLLTLLHVIPPHENNSSSSSSPFLANSLGALCKACKPEVEVEALVIQGPKLATVISQVKKLEVSVLVLGQKKPSPFLTCFCGTGSTEEFVEQCIKNADCLTVGVRKQSKGMGGYIISTRWQKNFWLLA